MTTVIQSLVSLFGLWIVVYYLWRDYRNDSYRDDIFSVRDEMFMYAAKENISFDNAAYTLLRGRMNALLRHGHDLTLTRLIILSTVYDDRPAGDLYVKWETAVNQLQSKTAEQIKEFNTRINIYVLQHLLYRSFFRYLVFRPVMHWFPIRKLIERPNVTTSVENLETTTIEEEDLEDDLVPA